MALCVGFDTSNYTTSAAWWDGREGRNESRILDVPQGALGLRQSDALFLHVRRLPDVVARLLTDRDDLHQAKVVAASSRPRAAEDSYMPCFLAGVCEAKTLASALGAEYMEFSHQQGHLAAAAWSAGREDLLDQPFLAWHLSGGTTELLLVQPKNGVPYAEKIGGTTDISAGQLLDRTGVLLGLPFPAGKYVDELYYRADSTSSFRVKVNELYFSLSGVENKVKSLREMGETEANIARFAVDTVVGAVYRVTNAAKKMYPGLPVLCSGGVASNSVLRSVLQDAVFALPEYSRDNAMGIAVLACRVWESREAQR
ncbi:MAG: DNA-binding protein [Clostridiales bacterium]|nr:DNA-binding protein [Clostridiales bacterium]